MAFNLEKARSAGKSDEEIARHLAQNAGFNVEKALAAGKTFTEIAEHLAPNAGIRRQPAKEADKPLSWGQVARGAVTNFIPSAGRAISDTWQAVTNPGETLENIGNLALGAGAKLIPGRQDVEKYADAFADAMSERYGGIENIKRTLKDDPFGVLADTSSVFTGGAGLSRTLAKGAAKAGKAGAAAKLTNAAEFASKAADMTSPLSVVRNTAGRLIPSPERVYQSALKASTTLSPEERARVLSAGVKERIPITKGGLEKANAKIEDLGAKVRAVLATAEKEGKTIDPWNVAAEAEGFVVPRFANQVAPTSDLAHIEGKLWDFLQTHGKGPMSPTKAQDIKQGTYRAQGKRAYDKQQGPDVEAEKALAAGIRKEQERIAPQVKGLNSRQGALLALRDQLKPALGRTGNWNMISLPGSIAGAAMGVGTANIPLALAIAGGTSLARNPWVKSQLAFRMDDARNAMNLLDRARPQLATQYSLGQLGGLLDLLDEEEPKKKK